MADDRSGRAGARAAATSRGAILAALRRSPPAPAPHPGVPEPVPGADRAQLRHWLEAAGARVVDVASDEAVAGAVAAHAPVASARRRVSTVPGIAGAETLREAPGEPHTLADVDVAIVRGELGVAENGAVAVSDAAGPHRALCFLAQHLVIVLSGDAIVADLHAAYARIEAAPERFVDPGWWSFIAGPSKTADIEQALVIGAHGPRSLLVVVTGGEAAGR